MKSIFISGASRGIGLELCRQNLKRGHFIIAACRNPDEATQLSSLRKTYENLLILPLDVDNEESVHQCFEQLHEKDIKIDVLFNNAGIIDWRGIRKVSPLAFSQVLRTNLVGAFLVLHYALPCLEKSSDPWVYNMSSRLGSIKLRGNTQLGGAIAYQCSKSGLNMLTKQASIDLASSGIKVVSISPGWVKTDMGGNNAKYEIQDSVSKIIAVTDRMSIEQNGRFLGEDGKEIPW